MTKTLINLKTKVSIIKLCFTKKLNFYILKTYVNIQKIDNSKLKIFNIYSNNIIFREKQVNKS